MIAPLNMLSKIQNFLSRSLSTKQKNTTGDSDVTKVLNDLRGKQQGMNRDLLSQAIEILNEAEKRFGDGVFSLVKMAIEKIIFSEPTVLVDMIAKKRKRGWFIRECVYTMIARTSGDMVEHLSKNAKRDELKDPMVDLLKIFDGAIGELVLLGDLDIEEANKLKTNMRKNSNIWPK